MYELGPPFSGTTVPPGTNLLITGPPLAGKRRLAMETLAVGARADEGTIIVSTRDSAARVRESFGSLVSEQSAVGIVDAVTQHIGQSTDADMTKYASSPKDMSDIGVKFSEFIQSLYTEQQREHNRVMIDSLTTLLLYSNLQTVFRFLHVFTSRIESVDGLGLYTIESTAHDAESLNTLGQLFDGTIDVDASGTATLTLPDGESLTETI
ncbi:recombinase RecA [Haloarcula sp. S1CR25-12]|uniref:Recombinase RecA n=1 Tax=Haloarcula saliterrae TaxID=2950534 RepID=A0ABU2FAI5_9EURY|nr:ATPase domain-containing protein [Haloarcula sp. S1CR25-12]MDS0259283.1 recombinase RecA [Haloarcula sp. S1CR25-12]